MDFKPLDAPNGGLFAVVADALLVVVAGDKRGKYPKSVNYCQGYVAKTYSPQLTEHIGFQWMAWPPVKPIQASTIAPLLAAVAQHFQYFPLRLRKLP